MDVYLLSLQESIDPVNSLDEVIEFIRRANKNHIAAMALKVAATTCNLRLSAENLKIAIAEPYDQILTLI